MEDRAEQAATATRASQPTALPPLSHQYQPVFPENSPGDALLHAPLDKSVLDSTEPSLSWRPFYLRRAVLFSFITIFVLVIATIEGLLAVSDKNKGIAADGSTKHYLWTYGPTAFFTAVAALWARTEYHSKLVAPWIRLSRDGAPASSTFLLDYVSQFFIFAIATSLRKGDYIVSITLIVSIIIKVLVVLSSGLISLSLTAVHRDNYPMVLQNAFVDDPVKLTTTYSDLPPLVLASLRTQNLTLPDGISGDYAYQTVQTNLPDTAETRVIVDGLSSSLSCEVVTLSGLENLVFEHDTSQLTLNVTLSSPGCNATEVDLLGVKYSTLFARFEQIQCDGVAGDDGRRILLMFGNLTYSTYYPDDDADTLSYYFTTVGHVNRSTQLLCLPSYSIDRVVVTRNATSTKSVTPLRGAPGRMLDSVTGWDIMEAHFSNSGAGYHGTNLWSTLAINISMAEVDVDRTMQLALQNTLQPGLRATSLFDPELLQQTATDYYRQITAVIVKNNLMNSASVNTTGAATVIEKRLLVRAWIAQWMVGLAAACVVLTTAALFIVPKDACLPRSPTTLTDLCSILSHSHELLAWSRYTGASDDEHLARFLQPMTFRSVSENQRFRIISISNEQDAEPEQFPQISSKVFHPIILHPAVSTMLSLTTAGIIIALELLLYKSNRENGLGTVGDDTYIHYTWTAIPALIFGALSMAFSAVDFQIRSLAPYVTLKKQVSRQVFTQLELLDATVPKVIYREVKLKALWAFATTIAFLFASLFTILSASLYQESSVPIQTSVLLQANQSFNPTLDQSAPEYDATTSSLILGINYSFPLFTYRDLAFPEFVPTTELPSNSNFNASTVSITAVVPAVRSRLDCRLYKPAEIRTETSSSSDTVYYSIFVDGENDRNFYFPLDENVSYVGQSSFDSNSDLIYLWGKLHHGDGPFFNHVAALGCNITLEGVDVHTTFIGPDLYLDSQSPPQPLENTVRHTTLMDSPYAAEWKKYVGSGLVQVGLGQSLIDPFFSLLVTSPWAIPMTALGEPSANVEVSAAIQSQLGIVIAQKIAGLRVPATKTNSTLTGPIGQGDNDAQPTYNATVTDATSRRRVVQDAASTHTLAALLGATLVLFIAGWAGRPSTDVLPRSPTTLASIMALLAGGNIFARLPDGSQFMSCEGIAAALGDANTRFWMGWGNVPDEEGRLTGGENEAGASQFGIFVIDGNKESMGS